MLFEIKHVTKFSYADPVFLEPHTVRLRPRCDVWQDLLKYELSVAPDPAGSTECIDLDGNCVTNMWFSETQRSLEITARSTVETLRDNPFDYVLESESLVMPVVFGEDVATALSPYRDRSSIQDEVTIFSNATSDQTDHETLRFLSRLTQRIHVAFECIVRPQGDPWSPSVTLARGTGACRDLAVLEMAAIRAAGLPARFLRGGDQRRRGGRRLGLPGRRTAVPIDDPGCRPGRSQDETGPGRGADHQPRFASPPGRHPARLPGLR